MNCETISNGRIGVGIAVPYHQEWGRVIQLGYSATSFSRMYIAPVHGSVVRHEVGNVPFDISNPPRVANVANYPNALMRTATPYVASADSEPICRVPLDQLGPNPTILRMDGFGLKPTRNMEGILVLLECLHEPDPVELPRETEALSKQGIETLALGYMLANTGLLYVDRLCVMRRDAHARLEMATRDLSGKHSQRFHVGCRLDSRGRYLEAYCAP